MLELWEPGAALTRLDRYLRDHGFLDRDADPADHRVADVYLGYGLSGALRRTTTPSLPEPARLPYVACRIREPDEGLVPGGPYRIGRWEPTWSAAAHARAIEEARVAIAAGEIYQVNLVQHLSAPFVGDPTGLARRLAPLRPLHPRPMVGDGWAIVSASPELFLSRRGDHITTMPIKGTRPAGGGADLRVSPKDAAEHVMIVDLERNDLGRVSVPGTVRWPELMAPRSMAGVEHLVSRVAGTIRPGLGLPELLGALFPGGSVTGAPKVAAIDQIARLEPVGRGASMGALGTIAPNGDLDLALTIRTFAVADGRIHLWVGGGIVWDSDPAAEVEESWVKARPLLAAIDATEGIPRAGHGYRERRRGERVRPVAVAVLGLGVVDPDTPVITADDAALARGLAAFETIRVYAGLIFALDEHLDRLRASAERLGLPDVSRADLEELGAQALAASGLREAGLRLYWTGGREHGGATAIATVTPVPPDTEALRARGLRVASLELGIDREVRMRAPWLLAGVKSTSYAVHVAAVAEAVRRGADDALLLATDGTVLEGAMSNVWWRRGDVLRTPSLETGILAGVTRAHLVRLAPGAGFRVEEGAWPLDEVLGADEVVLSSSVREVVGVIDVDGRTIGDGRPGPGARALQSALRAEAAQVG